jgi:L-ascorbate metabolism protein UlaG (beta-lactamase superfamily)
VRHRFLTLALSSAPIAAACRPAAPVAYQVEPTPAVIGCRAPGCAAAGDQVEITYLGVAGFLIRYRGASLLTAPFFTNPPLADVAPTGRFNLLRRRGGVVRPDTTLIERLLPAAADSATMIVVGHAHYDHLLDVPYVARRRSVRARVVGSATTRHTLMGDPWLRRDSARLVEIPDDSVGTVDRAGAWTYSDDSTFRVMALRADHAPALKLLGRGWLHYAPDTLRAHLDTLPERADEWQAGEPLAFLIDVLRRGDARPRLRVYFQDAPNTAPLGFPPRAALAERAVDVALLCAATAGHVPNAPDSLLAALRPAYVVVGHWESFFRPQTLPIRLNPTTDADRFLGALTRTLPPSSGWQMPLPRTTMRFDLR